MSMHEDLIAALQGEIDGMAGAIILSPTSVALAVQRRFAEQQPIEPHLQYASVEHLKQLARSVLGRRFDHEGDESASYQGELFSGLLQEHYPTPRSSGRDPIYKRREALSHAEVLWNVSLLRKSARARLEHADALEAWEDSRRRQRRA